MASDKTLENLKKELNLDGISDTIRGATPKDYYNEGYSDCKRKILISIMNNFDEIGNGGLKNKNAFLINGKWYIPLFDCDTIQNIIDEIKTIENGE